MPHPAYQQMLGVMQSRRGPYAGLDIPEFYALVEALFTPEQAELNNALPKRPVTAEALARQMQRPKRQVQEVLETMADNGLCATFSINGRRCYKSLPFMPGIFEYQFMPGLFSERHKEIARLIKAYKTAFETAQGVKRITFPTTRVIPVDKTIQAGNVIHTYDQVVSYIEKYDPVGVGTCYCRHAARLRGEDIHNMPMEVCLWFGKSAEYAIERLGGRKLSKTEALALLDRCEAAGLVHMSRNTAEDIDFLCNCDRWHCEVVTHVLKQPRPGWVFNSGFEPAVAADACTACELCVNRCPAEALTLDGRSLPQVNPERCFGCGVCASGCPEGAITLQTKAGFPEPPRTAKALVEALKANALKG